MHFVLQVTKILCEVWENGYDEELDSGKAWEHKFSLLTDQATSEARDQSDGKQGGSEGLPVRVTTLCELLVFVKNLELTSNSHLAGKTDRPGSK